MEVKPGYKRTEVGVIPEGWEIRPLAGIAQLKNGYAFKSSTYKAFGRFDVVTIANVQDGFMDVAECNKIDVLPHDVQPHHRLELGDILISMTGNVGRVCRVNTTNCLLNQRVGKLVPSSVETSFLFFMLAQRRFLTAMAAKAKGGAQGNLSVSDITDFRFPVPPTYASGEPHLHDEPVQSQDGHRRYILGGDPWRRGFEAGQGRARRGGDIGRRRLRPTAAVA
jgi:type I restriction enzyme S subunit